MQLGASTIRRKLSALSSLFRHLCERNAVTVNPVTGVKRPSERANEGTTPALGDAQARALLDTPSPTTLKGKRDRAILSMFLYHGLRADELCQLKVRAMQKRRGIPHLRIKGKGSKIRFVPLHPGTIERVEIYLDALGHRDQPNHFLFQPVKNNSTGKLNKALATASVYTNIVVFYAKECGIDLDGMCTHALRATAGTNALENEADIAKVQEWFGHANISTTRLYDRRKTRPEESPTFKVAY